MATIKLKQGQWDDIYSKIKEEYKDQPSVFMLRNRQRDVLGFTQRTHRYWEETPGYDGYGKYVTEIHLDFWNDAAETMFRLKYL